MKKNERVAIERDTRIASAFDQPRPIPNRDRTAPAHFRRRRVLDVDDPGNRSGAAQLLEYVVNIFHVGIYNTLRVDVST